MEHPKCRICETRHSPREACSFVALEKIGVGSELTRAREVTLLPKAVRTEVISEVVKTGKFDRAAYHKAYMREYMRRRRAKAKATATANPTAGE